LLATAGLATRIARTGDSAGTLVAGRVTHLTREPGLEIDPALSPDGRAIAYAAGVPGDMRIYVRQIDGGRAIAVAELLVDNQRVPRWSPDGTRLIFQVGHAERENAPGVSPNALYVVPAFGGVPRRLVVDSAGSDLSPAWSPDGARIAFVRGQGVYGQHIFVVDADGASAPTRLADAKEATGLRWSPDGSMLAFASGDPRFTLGTSHLGNDALSSIRIVTVADRQVHVVTAGTALDVSPLFTPDGRSLLFVSNRDGSRDVYHIAITRRGESRGNAHRLTSGLNAHSIDLSGDGRTLTYSAYSPYAHLWSEGGAVERVTTTTLQAANPEFSPDGNSIAFDEFGNGENLILVTTRSERGAPWSAARRIGAHAGGSDPSWSPDGRWVAYVLDGSRSCRRLVSPTSSWCRARVVRMGSGQSSRTGRRTAAHCTTRDLTHGTARASGPCRSPAGRRDC